MVGIFVLDDVFHQMFLCFPYVFPMNWQHFLPYFPFRGFHFGTFTRGSSRSRFGDRRGLHPGENHLENGW